MVGLRNAAPAVVAMIVSAAACGPNAMGPPPRDPALTATRPVPSEERSAPDAGAVEASATPKAALPAAAPSMPFDEAWAWLRDELPEETADLRPARVDLVDALLAWAPSEGETITVFDRACRPLRLTRGERALVGDIHLRTTARGKTKTVSGDTLELGYDITVVCGFDNTYERDAAGKWIEVASSATGCADTIGHHLSEVTGAAAWYAGDPVRISVKCGRRRDEMQSCSGGGERTCSTCERLALEIDSPSGRFRVASASSAMRTPPSAEPVDCSLPCPPDARGEKIAPAHEALAGADLEKIGLETHPAVFRTRASCRDYRKRHRFSAAELEIW